MEKKDRNHNSYCELPKGDSPSKASYVKKESSKGKENRELRILKKVKSIRERSCPPERNSPERFSGDGVSFRAKIIGTEQVIDARGNRMCQGALQRLKTAVKTSGDHKQKIILNISLDGIIIKDEKTGEQLHHHPIHKISFISQDTKDGRAFGYVYGCPQTGHQFFAIKTEKAASQVVVTLRDLFLVALEIKKSELERTQNQEQCESQSNGNNDASNYEKESLDSSSEIVSFTCEENSHSTLGSSVMYSNIVMLPEENEVKPSESAKSLVAEHANLQSELDILQQGISQMDHSIAVSESFKFSEDELFPTTAFQSKLDKLSSLYQETLSISSRSSTTSDYTVAAPDGAAKDVSLAPFETSVSGISSLSTCSNSSVSEDVPTVEKSSEDKYAVFLNIDAIPSIFDDPTIVKIPSEGKREEDLFEVCESKTSVFITTEEEIDETVKKDLFACEKEETQIKPIPAAFAELDPLGNQPYIDKRDFFQDIKNPPKKVLKDLAGSDSFSEFDTSQENVAFSNSSVDSSSNAFGFEEPPVALENPPKLPPKRSVGIVPTVPPELGSHILFSETKNPFNPFLGSEEEYFDIPPPSTSPPPPPPRFMTKTSESPVFFSPPPRPPSRVSGILTPPLPKRKVPLNCTNHAWFSFDNDASFPPETNANIAPPLPSPSRKIPPAKQEILKSLSASNSPSLTRRLHNKSPHLGCSRLSSEMNGTKKVSLYNSSPKALLSRHTSIAECNDVVYNPFSEVSDFPPFSEVVVESSPPLPPKPISISQKSPLKQTLASCTSSSSGMSVIESSISTRSSSSLVYSSVDENVGGTSSEALFSNSNSSEVFSDKENPKSSKHSSEQPPNEDVSPDSIFRRKDDPFADDFFLSLHKKPVCDSSTESCNNLDHFNNLKAPT